MIGTVLGVGSAVSKGSKSARDKFRNSGLSTSTEHINTLGQYDPSSGIDEAQWYANPYAQYDYRHSGIQKFLESLGFRSKYDEFRESMAINAREYERDLYEKAHNEEYDSAAAQAARERAAGINPDLAGNVDAGSSSGMEPDPNAPISPGTDADAFAPIAQFGSMMIDGINMAVGLAESGIGFMNSMQDLRGKKISNDNATLKTAFDAMLAVTSPEDMDNFMTSDMSVQAINYLPALTELFGKKRAKKYVSAVNRVAQGLSGHDLEAAVRNNFAGNWISYHKQTSGDGFSMFSDTMKVITKELSDDFWKNIKQSTKLEGMQIRDKQLYEQQRLQFDGTDQMTLPEAQAQNEGSLLHNQTQGSYTDWLLKQQQHTMQQSAASVIGKLNDLAENGNWFAGLAAMAIQFLFSRFSAGASVSRILR